MGISRALEQELDVSAPQRLHGINVRCALPHDGENTILQMFGHIPVGSAQHATHIMDALEARSIQPFIDYCVKHSLQYHTHPEISRTIVIEAPAPIVREIAALPYIEAVTTQGPAAR